MSQTLLKIKSKYNLKEIFSFVNYECILKIIKNNKSLQEYLGINIINYKKRTSYKYVTRRKILKGCYKDDAEENEEAIKVVITGLVYTIIAIILFIYTLIFASILVSKGAFSENNTRGNYNEDYAKIINKINLSLFGFLPYIIISYILLAWITCNCDKDYGKTKVIKKIVLVLIGILCICYEVIIIIKLNLSYKIKKNEVTWFMICDYVLIIIIFLYLVATIYILISYFIKAGNDVVEKKYVVLTKFRDINIYDYLLPSYFIEFNDYQKRKMLLNDMNLFTIKITKEGENIISLINNFRKNNNFDELVYDKIIKFKDLTIDEFSEPVLYNNENIFKLRNGNYLFKFPLNEFQARLNNREKNIINVILSEFLNKILIVEKNNILFIYLFHSKIKPVLKAPNDNKIYIIIEKQSEQSDRIIFPNELNDSGYNYVDEQYYEG